MVNHTTMENFLDSITDNPSTQQCARTSYESNNNDLEIIFQYNGNRSYIYAIAHGSRNVFDTRNFNQSLSSKSLKELLSNFVSFYNSQTELLKKSN